MSTSNNNRLVLDPSPIWNGGSYILQRPGLPVHIKWLTSAQNGREVCCETVPRGDNALTMANRVFLGHFKGVMVPCLWLSDQYGVGKAATSSYTMSGVSMKSSIASHRKKSAQGCFITLLVFIFYQSTWREQFKMTPLNFRFILKLLWYQSMSLYSW